MPLPGSGHARDVAHFKRIVRLCALRAFLRLTDAVEKVGNESEAHVLEQQALALALTVERIRL